MAKTTFRKERLEERIKNDLNHFLRMGFNDSLLKFVTFTKTHLNKDFAVCDVYWDTYNSEKRGDIAQSVKKIGGRLRTRLGSVLTLHHIPKIRLIFDNQIEEELNIERLLKE
jgi:ribosome-binding factor A